MIITQPTKCLATCWSPLAVGVQVSIGAQFSLATTPSRLALVLILPLMDTEAPFFEGKAAGVQTSPHIPFSTEVKDA